jgi:hypothetical protein
MSRAANDVDFWRGFALIEIFVNHIPGNFYEHFTHKALSQSDSAELFVFLAGWSLKHVVGPPDDPRPTAQLIGRLFLRAGRLYAAHMVIVMMAIAMLALSARLFDNPLILEWFNAASVFYDPTETHIGLVLLTHQLGYFDILPLYIVLLMASPAVALVHRHWPNALLPISFAIWFGCLVTETTFRTWPNEGEWFFNPLCWQFDFVLGFLLARDAGIGAFVRRHLTPLRLVAVPLVVVAAVLRWKGISVDPTRVPEPHLLFVDAKSFLTPLRLGQFLLLVTAFSAAYPHIARWARPLSVELSLLGRHSLLVFCIGSILSLAGQIGRFAVRGGILFDTAFVLAGIAVLFAAAKTADWWERAK